MGRPSLPGAPVSRPALFSSSGGSLAAGREGGRPCPPTLRRHGGRAAPRETGCLGRGVVVPTSQFRCALKDQMRPARVNPRYWLSAAASDSQSAAAGCSSRPWPRCCSPSGLQYRGWVSSAGSHVHSAPRPSARRCRNSSRRSSDSSGCPSGNQR